jgi:uncharacterized protein DUF4177
MQRWEYMWVYVDTPKANPVYVANGERLTARSHVEMLNALGKEGWELIGVLPPVSFLPAPTRESPQFYLKRGLSD